MKKNVKLIIHVNVARTVCAVINQRQGCPWLEKSYAICGNGLNNYFS